MLLLDNTSYCRMRKPSLFKSIGMVFKTYILEFSKTKTNTYVNLINNILYSSPLL